MPLILLLPLMTMTLILLFIADQWSNVFQCIDHSSMLHAWGLIENSHPQIKEGIPPIQERVLQSLCQIKDLNITQAAQADTMIEKPFLEWEKFPILSEDDYSQSNPKHGAWKNNSSPLISQAHCTSHPPSRAEQACFNPF